MSSGRFVTPGVFDKSKLSLTPPIKDKSGSTFRRYVHYAYTDTESNAPVIEPLVIGSDCEVPCPGGSRPEMFKEHPTGRNITHIQLCESEEDQAALYDVLGDIEDFLSVGADKHVKLPVKDFQIDEIGYANVYFSFVEKKNGYLLTTMRDKDGHDVKLPITSCNMRIWFSVNYPLSTSDKINVKLSLLQVTVGDTIPGTGRITFNDSALIG